MKIFYSLLAVLVLAGGGFYANHHFQEKKLQDEIAAFDKRVQFAFKDLWALDIKATNNSDKYLQQIKLASEKLKELKSNLPEPSHPSVKAVQDQYLDISQSGLSILEGIGTRTTKVAEITSTVPGLFSETEKYNNTMKTINEYLAWSVEGYDQTLDIRDTYKNRIEQLKLSDSTTKGLLAYNNMVHYGLAQAMKNNTKINPLIKASQNLITWSHTNRETYRMTDTGKMDFTSYIARDEFMKLASEVDTQARLVMRNF